MTKNNWFDSPLLFLLLSVIFLWQFVIHPDHIPALPAGLISDFTLTHLPNSIYLRDSILKYGQLPLWNTMILSGQPFVADPLSGVWYPPNLLLLVLPSPFAFNVLLWLHIAWAGWGMKKFLRAQNLSLASSLFGAIAFMATPKLIAHWGAGHVSLVFAVMWTPWLMLIVSNTNHSSEIMRNQVKRPERSERSERSRGMRVLDWHASLDFVPRIARGTPLGVPGVRQSAVIAATLAMIFFADVRWVVYVAMFAGAWYFAHQTFKVSETLKVLLITAFFFLSLTAILSLPLYEFIQLSDRASLEASDLSVYSMPPKFLLGVLLLLGPFHEWITYAGIATFFLACFSVARRQWFWIAVILVAAIFSLGSFTPVQPFISRFVPIMSLLRVPPRVWFLAIFALCVLAAHGAEKLSREVNPRLLPFAFGGTLLACVSAFIVNTSLFALIVSLAALTTFGILILRVMGKVTSQVMIIILIGFTIMDVIWANANLIRETTTVMPPSAAATWVNSQSGLFRVYTPSYSLPLSDSLQHAEGVAPIHLAAYSNFMSRASGIPNLGYSVSVPYFFAYNESESAEKLNAATSPRIRLLGLLNVKYVVAEYPVHAEGLALVQTFGRTRVYENEFTRPRAWLDNGEAVITQWTPNRIVINAKGEGQLVLSEVMYPGWRAWVDGIETPIETYEGLLRSVKLLNGDHIVAFEFHPITFYVGAMITMIGVIAFIGVMRWAR